ncbi:MAG TPA: YbhB/YbcL family Raf kinase inhibitor-like protein [Verrucomicrobiae bacterium]|nr:YbhB/YbcL family Raf kinase inhibitor-like protein [Verrucomicrobiae bacterium]
MKVAMAFGMALVIAAVGTVWAQKPEKSTMQLTSAAFTEGEAIPVKYTCEGKNVSPPLAWSGVPAGARSLALIADDPDAPSGTWVHWVVYGLPGDAKELAEDLPKGQYIADGAKQGLNDFKHLGYGGPCPPPGKAHHYFFKLYALDTPLDLKPGATKSDLERAIQEHILAEGQLMGTYKRK